jgi:hypothetical protein
MGDERRSVLANNDGDSTLVKRLPVGWALDVHEWGWRDGGNADAKTVPPRPVRKTLRTLGVSVKNVATVAVQMSIVRHRSDAALHHGIGAIVTCVEGR